MADYDPFPKPGTKSADTVTNQAPGGLRISLSGKTGPGHEAGLINVSGTVEEVAAFLKLDTGSKMFEASPFAAIVGTWNAGHHWAQGDYAKKAAEAKAKSAGKA